MAYSVLMQRGTHYVTTFEATVAEVMEGKDEWDEEKQKQTSERSGKRKGRCVDV